METGVVTAIEGTRIVECGLGDGVVFLFEYKHEVISWARILKDHVQLIVHADRRKILRGKGVYRQYRHSGRQL